MITCKVEAGGGWERLNDTVAEFRTRHGAMEGSDHSSEPLECATGDQQVHRTSDAKPLESNPFKLEVQPSGSLIAGPNEGALVATYDMPAPQRDLKLLRFPVSTFAVVDKSVHSCNSQRCADSHAQAMPSKYAFQHDTGDTIVIGGTVDGCMANMANSPWLCKEGRDTPHEEAMQVAKPPKHSLDGQAMTN